jgi:Ca-activated chloride channel family protein
VAVVYRNLGADSSERLSSMVTATFTDSPQLVEEKTNAAVMIAVAEQLAVEKNEHAVKLRDEGKIYEARKILLDNAKFLAEEAAKYESKSLEELSNTNRIDAQNLDKRRWNRQRKLMRGEQYRSKKQQNY